MFRRAIAPEKQVVQAWVQQHFSHFWASEVEVAFSRQPVALWVAQEGQQLLGFACYDCTAKAFFGPTGVLEAARGRGIGKILLVKALESLREQGYVYGIIGGVGPADYYAKAVDARLIPGSDTHHVYQNLLRG
ncbi:GNAT family N-acetyltransferase [Nitritalea halalkaliphila]|uniref:GNAT family N-acetyltransferase n=1 Tax=Nitritalea halalkaliphila TaxID=590849 RepID=UPI0002D287E8|nr:GNAT family N-acetyltransferase [Nitritalea halalkaliphila]